MKSAEYRDLFGNKNTSHAKRGAKFEDALNLLHRRVYDLEKTAYMVKNEIDWTYTTERDVKTAMAAKRITPQQWAKTGDGRYLSARKSSADFEGGVLFDINKNSVHVLFDAKETGGKSLPLANIKPHQIESLSIASIAGSIAGFLVLFTDHDRVFFLPALFVRMFADKAKYAARVSRRAASGTQSISLAAAEEFGIEVFKRNGFWDYREALKVLVKK